MALPSWFQLPYFRDLLKPARGIIYINAYGFLIESLPSTSEILVWDLEAPLPSCPPALHSLPLARGGRRVSDLLLGPGPSCPPGFTPAHPKGQGQGEAPWTEGPAG